MLVRVLLTFWIMIVPFDGLSQSLVNDYLQRAREEVQALVPVRVVDDFSNVSWIENSELRVGGDNDDKQSVALRLRPKANGQRNVEQLLLDEQKTQVDLKRERVLGDALVRRYRVLLDLINHEHGIVLLHQRMDLSRLEIKSQRNLAQTIDFRSERLQSAELRLRRLERTAGFSENRLLAIRKSIGLTEAFDSANPSGQVSQRILSLPDIVENVERLCEEDANSGDGLAIKRSELALRIAEQELKLTRVQEGALINLLQFKYDFDSNDDAFGFTVGVNLPVPGIDPSLSGRQRDVAEAQVDLQIERLELKQLKAETLESLRWLLHEHHIYQQAIVDIDTRLSRVFGVDESRRILGLKNERLMFSEKLTALHENALGHYTDLLYRIGKLTNEPLRNWLFVSFPEL